MKRKIDKEEFKLQWLAALLSGDFKQARQKLRLTKSQARRQGLRPGHCCLGVACEVFRELTGEGGWQDWSSSSFFSVGGQRNDSIPPPTVLYTFGLSIERARELADMNDDGVRFRAIAREIDEDI